MPEFTVTNPKMSSPLMGLQHLASLYSILLIFSSMTSASPDDGSLRSAALRLRSASASGYRRTALLVGCSRQPVGDDLLYLGEFDLAGSHHLVEDGSRTQLVILDKICDGLVYGDVQLPVLEFAFELLAPDLGILGLLLAQERLDLVASLGRDHEVEPVGLGSLVLLREDFGYVAVVQHLPYGHGTSVHLAARTCRAQRRVYVEGEVEQRGSFGQLAYVAVGREYEYLARGRFGIEPLCQRVGRVLDEFAKV